MSSAPALLQELRLGSIRLGHRHAPPTDFPRTREDRRLLASVREFGILLPPHISRESDGRYVVVDGHRRLLCARALGQQSVLCYIHAGLDAGGRALLQFQLHDTFKPWTQTERTRWRRNVKLHVRLMRENTKQAKE